ncbi:MAG: hypothetical protein V4568_19635 [Pseudomonadota bacterium]
MKIPIAAFILVVICRLLFGFIKRARARQAENAWLPSELRSAKLVFAERTFRTWKPFPLVARIDRGYLLNGKIVLTELKTRNITQAYLSDIVELSAQKLAMEQETNFRVSETAYVLTENPNTLRRHAHKVHLLSSASLIAMATRRQGIMKGEIEPCFAKSKGLCGQCVYRDQCRPELASNQ